MQLIAPLCEHAPFDELEPPALEFLAAHLELAYYPRGATITGPERGVADRLYIVKQGRVSADLPLGAGEFFPVGALLGRRPTTHAYRAEADTFCWELSGENFRALLERSPRFRAFCTDHLAMLLSRSQRRLRAEAGEALIAGAGMLAPLSSLKRRPPVFCRRGTSMREVLQTMQRERIGSMVVVDAAERPIGVFTAHDVLTRVALPQAPVDAPIERLMSAPPVTLEEEATLADAAVAMARHGIRHIVLTRDGRLTGVVSERDLFAIQRVGLRGISARIRAAGDLDALVDASAQIRQLARQLLAQDVGAEALTAMISALNDTLTRRVIELAAARATLPEAWCWLALGSEGRMEQTLVTDQDNALIYSGDRHGLSAFADEVNRNLDACGFPLCKGEIMARNPRWCLTLQEWRRVFDDWIRNNDPQALLNASIFFDFRPLAGEASLAGALRDAVLPQTRANRSFCRAMAQSALQTRPPLGLLADFSAAALDLKLVGTRPYVDAARVLALAQGSAETGTAARLRAAGEAAAVDGFHFVQALRLRHGANRVEVGALGAIERRVLKEAFRQGAVLQQRLRLDFGL
jgi:CBS domain-containing protein